MAFELKLSQKLSQTLIMTPQLQQAIKLLQLGRLDYQEMLEREILENPILEDSRESPDAEPAPEIFPAGGKVEVKTAEPVQAEDWSHSPNSDHHLDPGFGEQFGYNAGRGGDFEGERQGLESTLCSREGLGSHLMWQMRTAEFAAEDREIAAQIVGNLDVNGYLGCSVEELSQFSGKPAEDVERVLALVQTLDPPGIAARDLRECLMLQLDQQGYAGTLAWHIVDKHLGELELRHYEAIAKAENVTKAEVVAAIREVQKLEPRPGRPYADEEPIYIVPDVYVRKVENEYIVTLNESGLPKLRLNQGYAALIAAGNGQGDKLYVQEKLRAAAWLIKSIEQRHQTIVRVTESIVRFQREFLEHGVSAMRPLVLRDVANDVRLHESTVSRVTSNKYVHTPQGVYELKFFFSSGVKSSAGNVSSESVKEKIRELVASENPERPLSDQELAELLMKSGIDIARRTVAKYREMMSILSSSRRKKLV